MLAPWIVVVVERFEKLDILDNRIPHRSLKRRHADGHHDAAAPEGLPESIVQGAYLRPSCIPIFTFSICLTHCYLRRVTGEPLTRRSTRPRLSYQCIAATGPTGRALARQAATGRDRPRHRASPRP